MLADYSFVRKGLAGELAWLEIDEVLAHLENYLGNYLGEQIIIKNYINRLLKEKAPLSPKAGFYLRYLADRFVQYKPFDLAELEFHLGLSQDAEAARRLGYVREYDRAPEKLRVIYNHLRKWRLAEAEKGLLRLLKKYPDYILAADQLLRNDYNRAFPPGEWQTMFKCPKEAQDDWNYRLFLHYGSLGFTSEAIDLWERIEKLPCVREAALNWAAECFYRLGERNKAVSLYQRSLELDPLQTPIRFRLREILNPTRKIPDILDSARVNVYLYSYAKPEALHSTLQSLSESKIGRARIRVLLNGPGEESLAVVKEAREWFPENDFAHLQLHVNIGAPAARNWLAGLPETRDSDYVAFLDDDVLLEPDWLEYFLSTFKLYPKAGVVGPKVVFPGTPARYQYLYRNFSIARDDLIRISFDAPNNQYDVGTYDFIRRTINVMGCCHLFRTDVLLASEPFDIRFSPSQMDDIAHDVELCLQGHEVIYCGLVKTVHLQASGVGQRTRREETAKFGNVIGNDVKFYYKFHDRIQELKRFGNSFDGLNRTVDTFR